MYTTSTSQWFFAEVDDGTFMDDARKDWTADDYLEMDSENEMSDNQVSLSCVYYSLEINSDGSILILDISVVLRYQQYLIFAHFCSIIIVLINYLYDTTLHLFCTNQYNYNMQISCMSEIS